MDDAIRNAAVFGALALACAGVGWWPRWGGYAAAATALIAGIAAVVLGVVDPLAPAVWASAWPAEPLLLLAGWGLLAVGVRRIGVGGGWGPSLVGAFLGGAALGGLPVALGLAADRPPAQAARLAIAAIGGGLCGPLGSAPLLLLGGPELIGALWPLGLALGVLAASPPWGPPPLARSTDSAARVLLFACLPLWALAVWGSPQWALIAGLVLVVGLTAWRRVGRITPSVQPALHLLGLLACVALLVPAGVLDFLAWGLDDARIVLGGLLDAGFGLASLGLAALATGPALALTGALAICSDPTLFDPGLRAALVAGAAVGGLVPVMAWMGPGVLRAGAGRWALAVSALLVWLGWSSF